MAQFLVLAAFLATGAGAGAEGPDLDEMNEKQILAELARMEWAAEPGTYELPLSDSRIELREGQEIILGETAARYDYLTGGVPSPETEAVVWNAADGSMTFFTFYADGYVTDEDWEHIDAADFLSQMQEAQSESNAERERVGMAPFFLAGWRQEPTFEPAQHTAYWANDLTDAEDDWVNAVALRLSRDGYHHIIWSGDAGAFVGAEATLAGLLDAHSYDAGHRYEDYVDGDAMAGYSIGELAAVTMGVDFSTGAIAAILAFVFLILKKGGVVVAAAAAGAVAWLGFGRLKRRGADEPPPPTSTSASPPAG